MTAVAGALRRYAPAVVKLLLAAALLAWIAARGDLDLRVLAGVLVRPELAVVNLCLGAIGLTLSGLRWCVLLRGEGITLPVREVLRLTWIGHFWNMVIPGAVSGDAVKMYYVGRCAPEAREEAWTTVIADRVIGLAALVTVSTVAALTSLDVMWSRPELRATFATMLSVLAAFAVGGAVLAYGVGRSSRTFERLRGLTFATSLRRGYHVLLRLGKRPGAVLLSFALSVVAHGLSVFNALLLGRAAGEVALSPEQYFVLVPVAMFSNAVPITPGGIGVGETVLGDLFAWWGARKMDGVHVMLLLRVVFLTLAIPGAILYAAYRRHPSGMASPADPPAASSDPPRAAS